MSILLLLVSLFLCLCCQAKGNEEFDCVDIHKQPAFNHPLLKNHQIQMTPSNPMPMKSKRNEKLSFANYSKFRPQTSCPHGKVPIHRPQVNYDEEELRSFAKLHHGVNSFQTLTQQNPGRHFAVMNIKLFGTAFGARAKISLQNPPVVTNQVSMSQIWVESGEGAQLNSIQVGWAVHPRIYGDNKTRATAYWTADGSQKTGCYNTMCPGFVQVDSTYMLGQIFEGVSVIDGPQFITQPEVHKDGKTGNFWLYVDDNIKLGYWPKELFTHLNDDIDFLQFGGWTFNSPDGLSPPMGTGRFPDNHYKKSAYFAQIEYMRETEDFLDVQGLQKFVDNSSCYDLKYWENQGGDLQETFTYGGPGGMCGI